MTTDNEHPPAWKAALERFEGGYGSAFDPTDPQDIACFLPLLEEAVHDRITRELVKSFREATARIQAETRALDAKRQ